MEDKTKFDSSIQQQKKLYKIKKTLFKELMKKQKNKITDKA